MLTPRRWNVQQPHDSARALAERLKVSPVVAQILLNRGVSEPDDCNNFLKPSLKCLHAPELIPGLTRAAERVAKAVIDKQKIVIYGDYDVDGITAVAILWHAIRCLGGKVEYYIPHRIDEGYGLNAEALTQICDGGANLIITVDCGITAVGPAKIARERGVDLIITDHHEWHEIAAPLTDEKPGPILPACYAIVHPRLPEQKDEGKSKDEGKRMKDEGNAGGNLEPSSFILPPSSFASYPNPSLCGAGVAFKLAWGIGMAVSGSPRVSEEFRAFLMEATALAALGTVADVVPLIGENRVLTFYGLHALNQSKLHGIKALIKSAGLEGKPIDGYHVGFLLAPRLNASGRMGHANLAVQMLTDADPAKAEEIAIYLESQNRARQATEKKILDEALAQIEALGYGTDQHRAVVLAGEGWHPGVIGIVASRIVDRLHRPTIMVALNNGTGQGSGRSVSGFHLAKALELCGEHLEAFGGHEMAAGLKIRSENIEIFRDAFLAHANRTIDPALLVPELRLDCEAELMHMSAALVSELARLGPFGHGNRKPLICCRGVTLAGAPRRVGKTGEHLQLYIRQGQTFMRCIAFGAGEWFEKLSEGMTLDLAVEPQINEFNGRTNVELMVKDLQIA
jgi:single-stranded-DNA-specific exonuclease